MARGPKNRGGDSKKKPQLENQVSPQSVEPSRRFLIPSSAIDTVATYVTVAVGASAGIAQQLGHTTVALWLLFLTAWLAAIALIAHAYEKHWSPWPIWGHPRWTATLSGAVILALALLSTNTPQELANAKEGLIVPGNGPTPKLPRPGRKDLISDEALDEWPKEMRDIIGGEGYFFTAADIPESAVRVIFGKSAAWTDHFPLVLIKQGNEDIMVLHREANGVALSAKFFDPQEKIVCEIVKNRFFLNPENIFRIERTANRLKVFNNEAVCVLDVDYINPLAIRIMGHFFLRSGYEMSITEESAKFGDDVVTPGIEFRGVGEPPIAIWIHRPRDASEFAGYVVPAERTKADDGKPKQSDATTERMRLEQRPWLTPDKPNSESVPMAFKIAQAELTLHNSGKSPAIIRHFAMGRVEFSPGDDLEADFKRIWKKARDDKRETGIGPGRTHSFRNDNPADFVSDEALKRFHEGIIKIFLIGACEYTGVDGGDYALEWCFEYDFVTQGWLSYEKHNRVDVPSEKRSR